MCRNLWAAALQIYTKIRIFRKTILLYLGVYAEVRGLKF